MLPFNFSIITLIDKHPCLNFNLCSGVNEAREVFMNHSYKWVQQSIINLSVIISFAKEKIQKINNAILQAPLLYNSQFSNLNGSFNL